MGRFSSTPLRKNFLRTAGEKSHLRFIFRPFGDGKKDNGEAWWIDLWSLATQASHESCRQLLPGVDDRPDVLRVQMSHSTMDEPMVYCGELG